MNNPMKLKYHSLYGQLLRDRVLMNAWKKVKANRGSGGIDGVTIKEYAKNEQENILKLLELFYRLGTILTTIMYVEKNQ